MGARARACACKRECRRGEVTEEKFRRYICRLVGMNRSRPPTQSTEPLATGSATLAFAARQLGASDRFAAHCQARSHAARMLRRRLCSEGARTGLW